MSYLIQTILLGLAVFTISFCDNTDNDQLPIKLEWWQRDFEKWGAQENPDVPKGLRGLGGEFDASKCLLSQELKTEIRGYKDTVAKIIETSTKGVFKGKTFSDLAYFVDKYGPRISGSPELEEAISFLRERMEEEDSGFSNVHEEDATIPKWIRGEETAKMITPRNVDLKIKGLGFSVPTPEEGITGEVVVIRSFKELNNKKDDIKGKIVVYNSESGEGPLHCLIGAAMGARMGAIAALARSATTYSLYSPHTGIQIYDDRFPKIPVAALTLEDADLITRIVQRGEKVTIHMKMTNLANTEVVSRNVIGDYEGREIPNEYVIVAGHSDSWDVGQGAIDDGVGPLLSLEVVKLLKHLNLRPRRTLRNIYFTAEEVGLFGVRQYIADHEDDMQNYSAAIEADYGCLKAVGLLFTGSPEAGCIMHEIMELLEPTNATSLIQTTGLYTDIYGMAQAGVPGVVLNGDDGRYFWYHHTEADTMTALKPNELDKCLAVWASTAYVVADLKDKLPRSM